MSADPVTQGDLFGAPEAPSPTPEDRPKVVARLAPTLPPAVAVATQLDVMTVEAYIALRWVGDEAAPDDAAQVLSFDAVMFAYLPAEWTIGCRTAGDQRIAFTNSRRIAAGAGRQGVAAFTTEEWRIAAIAAMNERVEPGDVDRWCRQRLEDIERARQRAPSGPSFELTRAVALNGTHGYDVPQWPVWRVLEVMGLKVRLLRSGEI